MLINTNRAIKIIILFSLINSSVFIGFSPSSGLRLIIAALMNLSGALLILYFYKIKIQKFDMHVYFKVTYFILIFWGVVIFTRGFTSDLKDMISLFGHYLMGWAWLTPLAFVIGFKIKNWLMLFDYLGKLLLVGILLSIISFVNEKLAMALLEWVVFFPILLLTYRYQGIKNKRIVFFSILAFLLLSYFASQRANLIFLILVLMCLAFEQFRSSSIDMYKKIVMIFVFCISSVVFVLNLDSLTDTNTYSEKMTTDTRTFLFEEIISDMTPSEMIIGRGALGTYYSPYFDMIDRQGIEGGDNWDRQVNEIGYLQMLLKGGLVMLLLHVLIMLPAAFLAIFKSNNVISRMCGYYILVYLLMWSLTYYSVFSAEYILLWIAVGTAVSKSARSHTDNELMEKNNGRLTFE
jgi:hypothetical protein